MNFNYIKKRIQKIVSKVIIYSQQRGYFLFFTRSCTFKKPVKSTQIAIMLDISDRCIITCIQTESNNKEKRKFSSRVDRSIGKEWDQDNRKKKEKKRVRQVK